MSNAIWSTPWVQNLGWTLLHSLWQAPLLAALLVAIQRALGSNKTNTRYASSVGALALVVLSSLTTFFYLSSIPTIRSPRVVSGATEIFLTTPLNADLAPTFQQVVLWIDQHLPWLIQFWLTGFVLFVLRLAAGFWFIRSLRTNATPLRGPWFERTNELARQLGLSRLVDLAEAPVAVPLVVGYVKPVILFPIGLAAGLPPEQVETILLHELSHVKRHDFIINIVQSAIEAIFFFNPAVWFISSAIRKERENCCDDSVIDMGYAPLVYARTLAQLEESRLSIPLALGLGGRKNQLLNRIKRIMENSVQKDSGRTRFLPIALIMLGLLCTSWLTISQNPSHDEVILQDPRPIVTAADSTGKNKKEKPVVSSYERRSITRWDENGVPHEETAERFDGEGDPLPMLSQMDEVADAALFPPFPDMPDEPSLSFFLQPDVMMFSDSLPGRPFMRFNQEEWQAFEEEFKSRMKDQFKDFYAKNQDKLEQLMEEAKEKSLALSDSPWEDSFSKSLQDREMALMAPRFREWEEAMPDMRKIEEEMRLHQKEMQMQEKEMQRMALDMEKQSQEMKRWESRAKEFEKEVKRLLIQDGYLQKNEALGNIRIDDKGDIEVNGKSIKEKDRDKYRELHQKYFKRGDTFSYQE